MTTINCKVKYIRPLYNNLQEWMNDDNNIYIGRAGVVFINNERYPKQSSIYCNPFKIGKDGDRNEVLDKYKDYIIKKLDNDINFKNELIKLKDKNLGCWCSPDPCHGDILLDLIKKY